VALQPSPPAHRLIDLVEFLARHPGDEFTVSEIARGAGLNRTTCTSLLLALQARGWVRPRGRATFTLGSALIPLGEAALAGLDVAVEVQPELDALVADLGMEALASVVSGHEIIVVGHARTASVLSSTVRVGQTIPFVPPFGIAHLLHADVSRIDDWLDRSRAPLAAADRAEFRSVIAASEQRGYVVVLDIEARRRFEVVMSELAQRPFSRVARESQAALLDTLARDEQALGPWAGSETAEVSQISAPVFGSEAQPVLAIGIHALPHQIDPSRIPEYTSHVVRAAARVTKRIRGSAPTRV
jgi:DNA-binding IclR family transcriptional regulator